MPPSPSENDLFPAKITRIVPPPTYSKTYLSNKGFTLIELIIVIAIMAILVGVLAPNLLRYIERAQISSDTQLADSIRTAVMLAMIDPETAPVSNIPAGSYTSFCICDDANNGGGVSRYILDISGAETPFGAAVAKTLGYPDAASMFNPSTGIGSQLRYDTKCQIFVWIFGGSNEVNVQICGPKVDYDSYICQPRCLPTSHYPTPDNPLLPGHTNPSYEDFGW